MLRTVQLNDQSGFWTKEIHNIITNNDLPVKFYIAAPEIIVPQMFFLFSSIFSERVRKLR